MAAAILADVDSSGIYRIRNLVTGDVYIGSSVCFCKRWYAHGWKLRKGRHPNWRLQKAWKTFGEESFAFEVVEICGRADLMAKEQWHIDNALPAYNLAPNAGGNAGVKLSDAAKALISSANSGNKYCVGRVVSSSTRSKISTANRGKLAGRKQSASHIERRAQSRIGKKLSAETRAKIAAARAGQKLTHPRSAEYRAKIAAAHKRRRTANERTNLPGLQPAD